MKNKIIFTLLLVMLSVFSITSVEAKQCTNIYNSPEMYQIYRVNNTILLTAEVKTQTYNLYTAENVCKGSNTEVWFNNLNPWSDSHSGSAIHITLMEDDPEGNDDEMVKSYTLGYGYDGYFTDIHVSTINAGNIDSIGDQKCELYLSMYSSETNSRHITPANLFTYKICMN